MMDEELRQALNEVREMKKMCGNINMKLTNIVTQRGQNWKAKLEAEYQRGFEDGKAVNDKGCEECMYNDGTKEHSPCDICCNAYLNRWTAKPQEDDDIKVGDEVIYSEHKFIVFATETEENYASLFDVNGRHASVSQRECKKTGRHFDIEKLLEVMCHDS